ncbi:MAG: CoA transferase [Thermaurantiacus sp.]|uniref:CaiB/BaiF CoA transferase family protein n=1 Tax=Thermaurantiacus sp. TaxID=2820283 RepID=UPI00298EDDA6|nr:CoA transferase [Thermaurantiacus sp.]MDW8414843.1 CoA transferase [Thermaurantiacus sp.]
MVLDLTQFLPGPMLTRLMADEGARVVKIEPPGGDPAATMEPFEAGQSFWYRNVNRGKEVVRLDLKTPEGARHLHELIAQADVLVEGFRPGVMARLGFAAAEVRRRHPRLVWCSISAFGQTGPLAHHPAHDLGAWALSGFLSLNDGPDGTPAVPGLPASDMAAGLTALSAILMALLARERTGAGATIDVAMLDCLLPWGAHLLGETVVDGRPVRSAHQRSLGGHALYQVYRTRDDRFVVLCGREAKFARNLLEALGRPDLVPLAEAPAGPAHAPLIRFLADTFATRTQAEWVEWFKDRDVAFAPVLDTAQALAQPVVAERGLVVADEGAHVLRSPIRFLAD